MNHMDVVGRVEVGKDCSHSYKNIMVLYICVGFTFYYPIKSKGHSWTHRLLESI